MTRYRHRKPKSPGYQGAQILLVPIFAAVFAVVGMCGHRDTRGESCSSSPTRPAATYPVATSCSESPTRTMLPVSLPAAAPYSALEPPASSTAAAPATGSAPSTASGPRTTAAPVAHSTSARQASAKVLPSDHHTQKFSPPETTSTESIQRGKCSGTAAECFAETGLGDLQYWSPTLNADGSFEFDFQRGTP